MDVRHASACRFRAVRTFFAPLLGGSLSRECVISFVSVRLVPARVTCSLAASICVTVSLPGRVLLDCSFVTSVLLCSLLRVCPHHGKAGAVAAHVPRIGLARCDWTVPTHHGAALESWLGKAGAKLGEPVAAIDDEDWSTHPMAGKCGPCLPAAAAPKAPCSALALFGEPSLQPTSQRFGCRRS